MGVFVCVRDCVHVRVCIHAYVVVLVVCVRTRVHMGRVCMYVTFVGGVLVCLCAWCAGVWVGWICAYL